VPVLAIVGGREMRDGRVSLRERDGSQADLPLAEAVSRLLARTRPGALWLKRSRARFRRSPINGLQASLCGGHSLACSMGD
jgi:hypothetical protein